MWVKIIEFTDETGEGYEHLIGRVGEVTEILQKHDCGYHADTYDPMYTVDFGDEVYQFWSEEFWELEEDDPDVQAIVQERERQALASETEEEKAHDTQSVQRDGHPGS